MLLGALERRQAADGSKGPREDLYLRFDEGADRDDMDVVLRRAGGAWRAAYAEVPGWCQGTMQEWRAFYLASGAGSAWRPSMRFDVDAAGVRLDGEHLAGKAAIAFRLDQTMDEKLPPGTPVGWWDRFIPTGHTQLRRQTYDLDAAVYKDVYLFDLVLAGGVNWDPRKTGRRNYTGPIVRRPIFIRLQAPCTRFSLAQARTPTWNGGFHEADATGLTFGAGRLTGKLVVMLHQDGWMPWGRGKTYQKPPLVIDFVLAAALKNHVLSGTYKATGDMGTFEGTVRGRGGRAVIGRFKADGDVGEHHGTFRGMLLDNRAPPRQQVARLGATPAAGAAAFAASKINRLFQEIRALHLCLQHYPLPLGEALTQADTAAPVWEGDNAPGAEAVAAYVRALRELVTAARPPDAALPEPKPEGTGDSVSLGVVRAAVRDGVNVLPAGAKDEWYYLPSWQVIGPFEQRVGLANDTALVAEVVPMPGLAWRQPVDRFGARKEDAPSHTWQVHTCTGPRLGPPWEKAGFYTRFAGQVWYAAAALAADKARTVWLSLEACEHAKLWINGRLVWADAEKPWRYRRRGRAFVPVGLKVGTNLLFVRAHRDRRPSWVRLAVRADQPTLGEPPAQPTTTFAGPFVFPEADPPLAWDIGQGINVAWRSAAAGGRTRPVLAGDALLATSGCDTLVCADAATGKVRWKRRANILELIDAKAFESWNRTPDETKLEELLKERAEELGVRLGRLSDLRVREAVSDGRHGWIVSGLGAAACYDLAGKRRWLVRTNLTSPIVHLWKDVLAIEGAATARWEVPKELQGPDPRKRGRMVGVLLLDAATGRELARWTMPGQLHGSASRVVTCAGGSVAVLLTSNGSMIDLASRKLLPAVDLEEPGHPGGGAGGGYGSGSGYAITTNADTLFLTTQEESVAARLWSPDGKRLAYGHLWESNYEHGGFGSMFAPSVATERWLFIWQPVLERGPHCPDPRLELLVHDARTGRPLAKLKPAMANAVSHGVTPVVAGKYLFCLDSGGGSHGGSGFGQVTVTTADDQVQFIAGNRIDRGTTASPLFAGSRMYLRSPEALTCIAVTTDAGRSYQAKALAATLLKEIGAPPATAAPRLVEPTALPDTAGGKVPVGKLVDGRSTEFWLAAGPFPGGGAKLDPAGLKPRIAAAVRCNGQAKPFAAVSRDYAYNDPPTYVRSYTLQGTGDIVPTFSTRLDPQCCSGLQAGAGVFLTVLDNTRDRIVVPTLRKPNVTQWLGSKPAKLGEPLHLRPGLYPYVVCVAPEYYQVEEKVITPPVDVAKALAAGAIRDIGWPKAWKVFGPLPPDAKPLEPAALKAVPDKITVGPRDYVPCDIPADGATVYLTSLVGLAPGQKPDPANAPKELRIGVESLAYAFAVIDCPADGMLYVTACADWFMRWYLDGEVVYDTMKGGNAAAPTDVKAHPFAQPLTRGRHVLAVQVKPGSKGWSFSSQAGFTDKPADQLAALRVPTKQKPEAPDFRLAPAFKEVPHPPTRMRMWRRRVRDRRWRLQAVVRDLPGTPQARIAADLLTRVKD